MEQEQEQQEPRGDEEEETEAEETDGDDDGDEAVQALATAFGVPLEMAKAAYLSAKGSTEEKRLKRARKILRLQTEDSEED